MGLVALHGVCFAFLTNENYGPEYYYWYAKVFAIVLAIVVGCNMGFLALDSYYPILKLAVIMNIIDESYLEDPNANRVVEEFSDSDDLTEKDVSVNSKDMGKYNAVDYKDDKIDYTDPKEEAKRLEELAKKKNRPKSPPKTEEPLISNFGPKTIPLANIKDLPKSSGLGKKGNQTATGQKIR
jgi:hypothetical protein